MKKIAMEMDFQLVFYFLVLLLPAFLCPKLQAAASKSICGQEACGNVTIPYPFGINSNCYKNPWFEVTCKQTENGEKPFISRIDVELIRALESEPGTIIIKNPVSYINCDHKTGAAGSLNLTDSPFLFRSSINSFGSVGCGNWASVLENETQVSFGGCLQLCDKRGAGCYFPINENLASYTAKMTPIHDHPAVKDNSQRCASAFVFTSAVDLGVDDNYPLPTGINIETTHVPAALSWEFLDCQNKASIFKCPIRPPMSSAKQICGDVDIAFPFGLNEEDYMSDWFRVTCNLTENGPPIAFINSIHLQLLKVSFSEGTALVNHTISYSNCHKNNDVGISVDLSTSPFHFSSEKNIFWSAGCGNSATFFDTRTNHLIGGCMQPNCRNDSVGLWNVSGCRVLIPPVLTSYSVNMSAKIGSGSSSEASCGIASMVDSDSYSDLAWLDQGNISVLTHIPITLQWGTPIPGLCTLKDGVNVSCSSDDAYCWAWLRSSTHLCVCSKTIDGMTTDNLCEGKKCEISKYRYCKKLCLNIPGNYCLSQCPTGYEYVIEKGMCEPKRIRSSVLNLVIIIGCSTSIGTLFFLLAIWRMYRFHNKRRNAKLKQKYFKRNGGSLLEQRFSSNEGNVEKIKMFTSKEMEKATDYYNENRILGQGGQGTVYKGMLMDGKIVAIKKSKMMVGKKFDKKKVEQFVNEVIIVSQVNHRNVVKLLGCCLEAETPLLVYEFIPNGTLYDLIHHRDEELPLTWDMRLRIAIDIANAVFYLHSAASVPIYHRDIKSSNILLDDKYRAKVSDFGTSRSFALEQTHLTTQVQGTFGYMDPEYFRSSQFTEKSDVYSFAVVLVELLTGQKPISSKQSEEVRSLISFFLLSMQENSLFDILDSMVANGGPEKEIIGVAKLAKRCLNLNGKKRPTMKQVAMELELIKESEEDNVIEESGDEESEIDDIGESRDINPSFSTSMSITIDTETLPLNASF